MANSISTSISHWGMFDLPVPPIMMLLPGFKLSDADLAELCKPGRIVVMDASGTDIPVWRQNGR